MYSRTITSRRIRLDIQTPPRFSLFKKLRAVKRTQRILKEHLQQRYLDSPVSFLQFILENFDWKWKNSLKFYGKRTVLNDLFFIKGKANLTNQSVTEYDFTDSEGSLNVVGDGDK